MFAHLTEFSHDRDRRSEHPATGLGLRKRVRVGAVPTVQPVGGRRHDHSPARRTATSIPSANGAALNAHSARSYRRMVTGGAASSERYAFSLCDGVITALTFGEGDPSGAPAAASIAHRD